LRLFIETAILDFLYHEMLLLSLVIIIRQMEYSCNNLQVGLRVVAVGVFAHINIIKVPGKVWKTK